MLNPTTETAMRLLLLVALLTLAGCAPTAKAPVVMDKSAITRETAIQEGLAGAPPPIGYKVYGRNEVAAVVGRIYFANVDSCPQKATTGGRPFCKFPWVIVNSQAVNAWTDGNTVFLSTGMLSFVRNDNELALVFGHELAHALMGHVGKKNGNAIMASVLAGVVGGAIGVNLVDTGLEAGRNAYSHGFETEADYVGMVFAARAGFDVNAMPALWRRMAAVDPTVIHAALGATHPSSVERFLTLEATATEIERKRAAGLPLVPDFR
jgi:predicted Zn-dependent protease